MRPSNTGKSDPQQQPAPAKRGFFATAGERLKRVMSGAPAPVAPSAQEAPEGAVAEDGELTTSVQSKARELLLQDRTTRRGPAAADPADAVNGARQRRTSPPPLPTQRGATGDAVSGKQDPADRVSGARPKRPVRDSKSEALRARLGAAKAAMADAQAKRAAEQASAAEAVAVSDDTKVEPAPEAVSGAAQPQLTAASADPDGDESGEPIRTLTIARLLATQGYYDRSLSIYDQLVIENAEDSELRAEAERVRAQQSGDQTRESSS